jgi:hypothetical protein
VKRRKRKNISERLMLICKCLAGKNLPLNSSSRSSAVLWKREKFQRFMKRNKKKNNKTIKSFWRRKTFLPLLRSVRRWSESQNRGWVMNTTKLKTNFSFLLKTPKSTLKSLRGNKQISVGSDCLSPSIFEKIRRRKIAKGGWEV